METVSLWIDGRREAAKSGRVGEVFNPATGEVVRHVALAAAEHVAGAAAGEGGAWHAHPRLTLYRSWHENRSARGRDRRLKISSRRSTLYHQSVTVFMM